MSSKRRKKVLNYKAFTLLLLQILIVTSDSVDPIHCIHTFLTSSRIFITSKDSFSITLLFKFL